MTSSKSFELIEKLEERVEAILNKVHTLLEFQLHSDSDIKSLQKWLGKKYGDENLKGVEKMSGYSSFNKNLDELLKQFSFYHSTIVEAIDFQRKCQDALLEIFVSSMLDDSLKTFSRYMDLLVSYSKVLIMLGSFDQQQIVIATYQFAASLKDPTKSAKDGDHKTQIQHFYSKFCNDPIKFLQSNLKPLGNKITKVCNKIKPQVMKYLNDDMLKELPCFGYLQETPYLSEKIEAECDTLSIFGKMKNYIIFGQLICPSEFKDDCLPLLQMLLSDRFVFHIHRDFFINIQAYFERLTEAKIIRINKAKKYFREIEQNVRTSPIKHKKIRFYLSKHLQFLIRLFTENPCLLALRIKVVYSCLSIARDEILWFFDHRKYFSSKTRSKDQIPIPNDFVALLIHQFVSLQLLVCEWQYLIYKWNSDKLHQLSSDFETLLSSLDANDLKNQQILQILQEVVLGAMKSGDLLQSDVSNRLLDQSKFCEFTIKSLSLNASHSREKLLNMLETIIQHSMHLTDIKLHLLDDYTLKDLWFYRDDFIALSQNVMKDESATSCDYIYSFIHVLSMATDNVHPLYSEEIETIGQKAVQMAYDHVRLISKLIAEIARRIFRCYTQLSVKLLPVNICQNITSEANPGNESYFVNHKHSAIVKIVIGYKSLLSEIGSSMRRNPFIDIYNRKILPSHMINSQLENLMKTMLNNIKNINKEDKMGNIIPHRPSTILHGINVIAYTFSEIERYLCINVSKMLKYTLISEFYDKNVGGCTDLVFKRQSLSGTGIAHVLADQWVNIFSDDRLSHQNICYSSMIDCFVNYKTLLSENDYNFQQNMDLDEIKIFVQIGGPIAVRIVDYKFLNALYTKTAELKTILFNMKAVLENLENIAEIGNQQKFVQSDEKAIKEASKLAISIGCMLKFRQILYRALREVSRDKAPYVYNSVLFLRSHQSEFCNDRDLECIDCLSFDCGLTSGKSDRLLQNALKDLAGVGGIQRFLPELFGIIYVTDMQKQCFYIPKHEALSNNGHLLGHTLVELSRVLQIPELDQEPKLAEQSMVEIIKRFVNISSISLLHMSSDKEPYLSNFKDHKLHPIIIFLEYFISSSHYVTLNILEQCCPFTILRNSYTLATEDATKNLESH